VTASQTPNKPSGLLARGKAEFRKVSDKIKEKEKGKDRAKSPAVDAAGNTESLKVT
jgi:hypothetical protein